MTDDLFGEVMEAFVEVAAGRQVDLVGLAGRVGQHLGEMERMAVEEDPTAAIAVRLANVLEATVRYLQDGLVDEARGMLEGYGRAINGWPSPDEVV